ncbi:immunoglobulin superfamily, partial [Pimephales promelas]
MLDFGCRLWHLTLLLCLTGLLQGDLCYGQRLVQIQEGPLYRVKGYPISISCNVSGFKGPSQQDFEFKSLSEGDPLQLECQVSSETYQHTHLSVSWFLHSGADENPRPIITLDKDLTVKPGAGFEDRYHAGLISMDKVEDTTYRLKMSQVQQSDQGNIYCRA